MTEMGQVFRHQDIENARLDIPIPMDRWGKDHWGTLAYLETRIVDHRGIIEPDKMRCGAHHSPYYLGVRQRMMGKHFLGEHPTRLNDGKVVFGHDDWDCLDDMIAAGLVTRSRPPDIRPYPGAGRILSGLQEAEVTIRGRYRLTKTGRAIAAKLREHIADGKGTGSFRVAAVELVIAVR